jgi:hypothetical protein
MPGAPLIRSEKRGERSAAFQSASSSLPSTAIAAVARCAV